MEREGRLNEPMLDIKQKPKSITRACTRCGEEMHLSRFYKNRARCKACFHETGKESYKKYYENNKETVKERSRARSFRNKEKARVTALVMRVLDNDTIRI